MFHAVNQTPRAEDDGMLPPSVPMFRDTSSFGRGSSGPVALVDGSDATEHAHSQLSSSAEPAPATRNDAGGSGHPKTVGRHAPRRALRSRRIGRVEVEMRSAPGSEKRKQHHRPSFAGPDGLDNSFAEPGTFRWDATVADAALPQPEDVKGQREMDAGITPHVIGRARRVRLASTEVGDIEASRRPWFIMLPESKVNQVFDHLGDLLTLYVVVAIPLFVSFQHIENMHAEDWYAFNIGVDLLFLVDFMGRLLTAYYDDAANRLVFEPALIARRYANGLLVPDLIASVPLTIILGVRMVSITNKVTRLARMPQTLRLIRSIKALSEEAEGTNHKNILLAAYNLVKVILYLLLVMHWVACGWHLLADLESNELSWIEKDGLDGAPASKLYVTSVYWTVTTLSTVGYGDIFASTIAERTYCILVMLTGATMYALAIGAVSHIITKVVARHSHSRQIERHAELFVRMHALPLDLSYEIMRTLNLSGETEAMVERRAERTLELLPADVRTETLLFIYRSQIARIPFLRNRRDVHPMFVASFARSLHAHIYPKAGEEVLFEDSRAEEVMFLVRGRAVITRRGLEVGRMIAGSCFGASAALYKARRRESVKCATDCELYTIEGKALKHIAKSFPGLISELLAEAEKPLAIADRTGNASSPGASPPPNGRTKDVWHAGPHLPEPPSSVASTVPLADGFAPPGEACLPPPARRLADPSPLPSGTGPEFLTLRDVRMNVAALPTQEARQEAVQRLATSHAQAARAEAEAGLRLDQLTSSVNAIRHYLRACGVLQQQVIELLGGHEQLSESGEAIDAPLANLGTPDVG